MKIFLGIGTGPGIGLATAERFASEGFKVVLSSRNMDNAQRLAQGLVDKGYNAIAKPVDAGDPASISSLITDVEKSIGPIDVLHYNAGVVRESTLAEQPLDTLNSDLAVNIGGALAAIKSVERPMVGRGSGTILFTGGGLGLTPLPNYLSLSIGKAGVRTLALALYESFQQQDIHLATVTVKTSILPDSPEATAIGEQFWELYKQEKNQWVMEVEYPVA